MVSVAPSWRTLSRRWLSATDIELLACCSRRVGGFRTRSPAFHRRLQHHVLTLRKQSSGVSADLSLSTMDLIVQRGSRLPDLPRLETLRSRRSPRSPKAGVTADRSLAGMVDRGQPGARQPDTPRVVTLRSRRTPGSTKAPSLNPCGDLIGEVSPPTSRIAKATGGWPGA